MAEKLDPQVQMHIMDLALEVAKASIPRATTTGEVGLEKYTEYIDKAYKALIKTIAG